MPARTNIVKVHDLSVAGLDPALNFISDFVTRPLIQVDLPESYQLVFVSQKFSGFCFSARDYIFLWKRPRSLILSSQRQGRRSGDVPGSPR